MYLYVMLEEASSHSLENPHHKGLQPHTLRTVVQDDAGVRDLQVCVFMQWARFGLGPRWGNMTMMCVQHRCNACAMYVVECGAGT